MMNTLFVPEISKEDFLYNILRMENIKIKHESVPELLSRITTDDVKPSDIEKIDNILRVWDYINNNHFTFNIDYICEINRQIEFGINSNGNEGKIRSDSIKITNSTWTPPIPSKKTICEALQSLSKDITSIEKDREIGYAIRVLLFLMKYQLFDDGNKRTAQIVACSILSRDNLVVSIPFIKQKIFFQKLINFYESDEPEIQEDIYRFILSNALFRRDEF